MPAGRPRAFDTDKALDRAMDVFWRKGYEGASIADLTEAMGINPPSLYAAFGNKQGLFRGVIERYEQMTVDASRRAYEAPTARAVAEQLLRGAADWHTDPSHPRGCLMVQGIMACDEAAEPLRLDVNARRAVVTATLRRRFERAKAEGDLPADVDPAGLARYVVTIVRGMAVEAAGGASRKDLRRVVEVALRGWPPGRKAASG